MSTLAHAARIRKAGPLTALALVATLGIAGCAGNGGATPASDNAASGAGGTTENAAETHAVPAEETPTEAGSPAEDDLQQRFAERDEFFAEQEQAPGEVLVAKTPAQIEFTTRQREYIEANGAQWSAEYEDLILALALNACETSILNGHQIDETTFVSHYSTSPQIQAVTQGRTEEEVSLITQNLTEIMKDGTAYLCPDDFEQWDAAWQAHFAG